MANRRTFLKLNLAASASLAIAPNVFASKGIDRAKTDFLFVESTKKLPIPQSVFPTKVVHFQSDPIDIWTSHCLPAMKSGYPVFAGITSGFTAFSLSEIARDYGYVIEITGHLEAILGAEPLEGSMASPNLAQLSGSDLEFWILKPNGIQFRQPS